MPQITRAAYLRERAVNFRRLAEDHGKAGNHQISAKMTEVAADFEAQATELVIAGAATGLRRRIEAVDRGVADLEALAAGKRSRTFSLFNDDDLPAP
jgi:hypothetical protein